MMAAALFYSAEPAAIVHQIWVSIASTLISTLPPEIFLQMLSMIQIFDLRRLAERRIQKLQDEQRRGRKKMGHHPKIATVLFEIVCAKKVCCVFSFPCSFLPSSLGRWRLGSDSAMKPSPRNSAAIPSPSSTFWPVLVFERTLWAFLDFVGGPGVTRDPQPLVFRSKDAPTVRQMPVRLRSFVSLLVVVYILL